jgi:hypothetical protein
MKIFSNLIVCASAAILALSVNAFVAPKAQHSSSSQLNGLFDKFRTGGSGRDRLDEEWEKQQAILAQRRAPKKERDAYFKNVEDRREEASKERQEKWGWQTKKYGKGEDPLDEWKKRRKAGSISDLDNQYGDPKKVGGIPMPMARYV